MSPARAHQARTLAALAAAGVAVGTAGAPPESGPAASAYEQVLIQLGEDRRRLHDIQSIERKIEAKRQLYPAYAAWVDGALQGAIDTDRAVQDEIVATMMVWAIDVGAYDDALRIGDHVLRWKLALPERYKRQPAVLLTEEIAEAALSRLTKSEAFDLTVLLRLDELVAAADMPDQVRAKLEKALGLELARAADAESPDQPSTIAGFAAECRAQALARFRRALELNASVGVKKNIERLEAAVRRDAQGTTNTGTEAG